MHDRAVAGERGGLDQFVVPVDRELFLFLVDHRLDEGKQILGVERGRRRRDAARHVEIADDLDAADFGDLAGPGAFDIAAALDREIDDHRAGRIEATISLVMSRGAGRPGISAVVMTMSCFLMCSATSAACLA